LASNSEIKNLVHFFVVVARLHWLSFLGAKLPITTTQGRHLAYPGQYRTRPERLASDMRPSLFGGGVSDEEIKVL
jgi:hypothetical protein